MFKITVTPQFANIDALKHVNNNTIGNWFELGRNDIFRFFDPALDLQNNEWELILVRTEIDFIGQIFYNHDVEIRTYVLHIGNTSFIIGNEAWQEGELKAKGKCVLVNYDFNKQEKKVLNEKIREQLREHLINESDIGKDI
ncbi:MAG: acyl-CoA thioesterase [archaeon]|nr:acyl-CoA thioesterase [archaeon]